MALFEDQMAVLVTLSPSQLRQEWQKHCKSVPPDLGPTLLRLGIAYRLQARRQEGLDASALREIAELGAVLDRDGSLTTEPMARIKPGTRLLREWHGTTHQVLIIEKGYVYRDQLYRSLTQIAHEITGARWSGPRFFGLARRSDARPIAAGTSGHG